ARGGTLHQHLPAVMGEAIPHRQAEPGHVPTHWVTLTGPSRLRGILGCRRTRVNSFHHQAVAEPGVGLRVTGRASDGTIESLEAEDRDFAIGVQWHAECLVDRERHLGLFRAFVQAARSFEQTGATLLRAA
ncbi:MAG TPA: gamma-glutamyl-gamma-aminobutyrate hydrolase family protein, partial [Solirubrobacteraceae bacterium]|nr:gamma-glutamyl-gamma-aminobutyrate hydrolase family protein [Solirubrobacteraceae bacterium]